MEDNLRQAIQDYFLDHMDINESIVEDHAEGLYNYLGERGWDIIDKIK